MDSVRLDPSLHASNQGEEPYEKRYEISEMSAYLKYDFAPALSLRGVPS
jgi:hypothetical protein